MTFGIQAVKARLTEDICLRQLISKVLSSALVTEYKESFVCYKTMGGTALGKPLPRLSRAKYEEIVSDLKKKLKPEYFLFVQEPRNFISKTSFGDVDLLVTRQQKELNPVKDLEATSSIRNGNIVSMEYCGYQVDLIKIPEDKIDLSSFFYGYADTGMIFGMLMRNIGLKFGMNALTLKLETYKIKLSHELRDILRFWGLNYDAWQNGFDTEQEIFEWIASCKYFCPSFFARAKTLEDAEKRHKHSENFEEPTVWTHEARKRLDKRPMFQNWIEYVSTLHAVADRVETQTVKSDALDFFDKREEYACIETLLAKTRRLKAKFNGKLAMTWTDNEIQGKALGVVMAAFKQKFSADELDSMSIENIEKAFKAQVARTVPSDSVVGKAEGQSSCFL